MYRLICKGTVEEKIVKRANQKNTVQQLVMTGGHSQGDVFEAEEVVSLLLDDAELEQKMKEQLSRHRVCLLLIISCITIYGKRLIHSSLSLQMHLSSHYFPECPLSTLQERIEDQLTILLLK